MSLRVFRSDLAPLVGLGHGGQDPLEDEEVVRGGEERAGPAAPLGWELVGVEDVEEEWEGGDDCGDAEEWEGHGDEGLVGLVFELDEAAGEEEGGGQDQGDARNGLEEDVRFAGRAAPEHGGLGG